MDYLKKCFIPDKVEIVFADTVKEKAQIWRECSSRKSIFPSVILTIVLIIVMYVWSTKKFNNINVFYISIIPLLALGYGLYILIENSFINEANDFENLWKLEKQNDPNLTEKRFINEMTTKYMINKALQTARESFLKN